VKAGRKHSRFPRISANPLHHLKIKRIKTWIKGKHARQAKLMKIKLATQESDSDSDKSVSDLEESFSDIEERSSGLESDD